VSAVTEGETPTRCRLEVGSPRIPTGEGDVMSRDRRWVMAGVGLIVVVAGCGGGGDDAAATDALVVASDDGRARLLVPAGAVPSGVDITIESADVPEGLLAEGVTGIAYDLQPSGLVFDAPALLTLRIPYDAASIPVGVAVLGDDGDFEAIPASFESHDGELVVEAEVAHFSRAVFVLGDLRLTVESDCPESLDVGETCSVESNLSEYPQFGLVFRAFDVFRVIEETDDRAVIVCDAPNDGPAKAVQATLKADFLDVDFVLFFFVGAVPPGVPEYLDSGGDDVWKWSHSMACRGQGATTTTTTTLPGSDPVDDQEDGSTSQPVPPGEGEPGSDITRVAHRTEDGKQIFTVEVAGMGQALAESEATNWYDVIIEARGPGDARWGANATYFAGEQSDRGVRAGPNAPGRERVEGATVTVRWVGPSTMEVVVDPAEADLAVEAFEIVLIARLEDGDTFVDDATGLGGS